MVRRGIRLFASRALVGAIVVLLLALVGGGCGARTSPGSVCAPAPTPITQPLIERVDLLFAIDNSASMGDKQALLREAIPDLVDALLVPDCLNGNLRQKPAEGPEGLTCPTGFHFEFPPVHDLHVGIVSSSLGGGGASDVCNGKTVVPAGKTRHDDDHGRLLNRHHAGGEEVPVDDARPIDGAGGNFLAWLPSADPKNQGQPQPNVATAPNRAAFVADFQELVAGVEEYGCGLEAQLESWYRFLVQPDPWERLEVVGGTDAQPIVGLGDVDRIIVKQRKDFLREDSLVAIIMLTDEEDSWSDPLALSGRGWLTRTQSFPSSWPHVPGAMPRATSECSEPVDVAHPESTGPNGPDCLSCAVSGNKPNSGTPVSADPECQKPCSNPTGCIGFYGSAEDGLNVRYTNDMKRRYGVDPQFPIERYVDGLRSLDVPNREGEHAGGTGPYLGKKNCKNPLFSRNLPDGSDLSSDELCFLQPGPRTPDLVFFAIIGGVPWQLLATDATNPKSAFKLSLDDDDWRRIVGADPAHYLTDGIDPHMVESIGPRVGLPPPSAGNTADPVHGREWRTVTSPVGIDLQYACTFPLPSPRDCSAPDPGGFCDCSGPASLEAGASPLCQGNTQLRGKAYPTIRQLRVAKALGAQGIVGSLCARNTSDHDAPDYGYRPVMGSIVDRLRPVLAGQCLPRPLVRSAGKVDCDVYVELPEGTSACDPTRGLRVPSPAELACWRVRRLRELQASDPSATEGDLRPVCLLDQIPTPEYQNGTCELTGRPGWCYLGEGETGSSCPQALRFSKTRQPPPGSRLSLGCR